MYRKNRADRTQMSRIETSEGEFIETQIMRMTENKEKISTESASPLIYTERKEGIIAAYDVRTDRFEVAIDGMDAVSKIHAAKRENRHMSIVEEEEENPEGKKLPSTE